MKRVGLSGMSFTSLSLPLGRLAHSEDAFLSLSVPGPSELPVHNATKSFWLDSSANANPLADEGRNGPLTTDADVCIVGSGISGISVAHHLSKLVRSSRNQLKVVILEAREFCSGATGRNGGHLTPASFLHFRDLLQRFGEEEAKRTLELESYDVDYLLQLITENGWADDIDLVKGNHTVLLFTDEEKEGYEADYEAARRSGVDLSHIEWIPKDKTFERYGTSFESVRTPGYNLWPLKLVTKLFQVSKDPPNPTSYIKAWLSSFFGAKYDPFTLHLHTHTPAQSINRISTDQDPFFRWSIDTPRGEVKARYVVHATNAYASHLLPHLQGPSGIIPTRAQVVAIRAATSEKQLSNSGWSANQGFEYWFPRPLMSGETNPLVILGGGREIPDEHELYISDDSTLNSDISKALRKFLPTIFPGRFEENSEPEMEWTGIMGFTATGDPFVGPVVSPQDPLSKEFEGQFISAGFSGHGMSRATACAQVVAQMIINDIESGGRKPWVPPLWMPHHYMTKNA